MIFGRFLIEIKQNSDELLDNVQSIFYKRECTKMFKNHLFFNGFWDGCLDGSMLKSDETYGRRRLRLRNRSGINVGTILGRKWAKNRSKSIPNLPQYGIGGGMRRDDGF